MFYIIGRSGSGKDTIASYLSERYGLKQLISCTTRDRRTPDESTHVFVTREQAEAETDIIAITEINGHLYYATKRQLDEADIYVIDPRGLQQLAALTPDATVIYVEKDEELRRLCAQTRGADPQKELELFKSRIIDEDEQFVEFEKKIKRGEVGLKTIVVQNNGTVDELYETLDELLD